MSYITVSAKIRRNLYDKIKKFKIPVSKVIRKALEEEVKKKEEEEVIEALQKAQGILKEISSEELVKAIREEREER